jgi:two-component system, OmpR family, alkaline phosphatase synthesis response regulator PhoP
VLECVTLALPFPLSSIMAMPEQPTVMIADDEEGLRRLVWAILGGNGCRLLEAGSGIEALELARRERPDVMLLDVAMPGLDGIAICAALKSHPDTAGIKVAMLTAMAEEDDRELGLAAGADRYITKPFSPSQLVTEVRQLLG